MRHSAVSARAGFPRCSPIVWRSASSALLALVVVAACGSTAGSGGTGGSGATGGSVGAGGSVTRDVPFAEVTSVAYGRHDTGPAIVVALNDQWRATLSRLVDGANVPNDRVAVAAFQGEQISGGFSIQIERIERNGDELVVHAKFTEPAPGSMNTMALTSPVHVVSIAATDAKDLMLAVLLDGTGAERAKATLS
jgi:hypothetical protein